MYLISKCKTPQIKFKTTMLAIVGILGGSAFFIPPEFYGYYLELCDKYKFFIHFDKIFHFMFFACVALNIPLTQHAWGRAGVFILLIIIGFGIEAVQYYIPNRGASLHDLLANTFGIVFGGILRTINT